MKSVNRITDSRTIKSIDVVKYIIEIVNKDEEEVYESNITLVVKILKDNGSIKKVKLIEQRLTTEHNYDKISKKFAEKFIAKNEIGKLGGSAFLKLLRLN